MMQIRKFLIFPEFWTSGQGDWHWSYLIMHLVTLPSYDTVNLLSKIFLKIQTQEEIYFICTWAFKYKSKQSQITKQSLRRMTISQT